MENVLFVSQGVGTGEGNCAPLLIFSGKNNLEGPWAFPAIVRRYFPYLESAPES